MSRVERDSERGRAVAAELKTLGVKKRELIRAAEQGYITELACKMPECFCPEELGGASYFAQVTNDWSDWRSNSMPTLEHFPVYKKDGGKAAVDNAILAHRLCKSHRPLFKGSGGDETATSGASTSSGPTTRMPEAVL
jgi:hypothetical protein